MYLGYVKTYSWSIFLYWFRFESTTWSNRCTSTSFRTYSNPFDNAWVRPLPIHSKKHHNDRAKWWRSSSPPFWESYKIQRYCFLPFPVWHQNSIKLSYSTIHDEYQGWVVLQNRFGTFGSSCWEEVLVLAGKSDCFRYLQGVCE